MTEFVYTVSIRRDYRWQYNRRFCDPQRAPLPYVTPISKAQCPLCEHYASWICLCSKSLRSNRNTRNTLSAKWPNPHPSAPWSGLGAVPVWPLIIRRQYPEPGWYSDGRFLVCRENVILHSSIHPSYCPPTPLMSRNECTHYKTDRTVIPPDQKVIRLRHC